MQDQGAADEEQETDANIENGVDAAPVEGEHERDVGDVEEEHEAGDEQREKGAEDHQPEPTDERQKEEAHLDRASGTLEGQAYYRGDLEE